MPQDLGQLSQAAADWSDRGQLLEYQVFESVTALLPPDQARISFALSGSSCQQAPTSSQRRCPDGVSVLLTVLQRIIDAGHFTLSRCAYAPMSTCLQVTSLVGQLPAELRQLLPCPPVQNAAPAIDVYAHPAASASGLPAALATEESPAALLANQLGATLPNRCRLFLRGGPVCLSGCHVICTQAYPAGCSQTYW